MIRTIFIVLLSVLFSTNVQAGTLVVDLAGTELPHAENSEGKLARLSLLELSQIHPNSQWDISCDFSITDVEEALPPAENPLKIAIDYHWGMKTIRPNSTTGYVYPYVTATSGSVLFEQVYVDHTSALVVHNLDATANILLHHCQATWRAYY